MSDEYYYDPVIVDAMNQDLEDFGATSIADIWGPNVDAGNILDAADYYGANPEGAYFGAIPSNGDDGYEAFIQSVLAQQETPSVMMPLSAFGPAQSTEQLISSVGGVPLSSLTGTQFADLGQAPEQSTLDKVGGWLNSFTEQKTNPYDQVLSQAQADGRNLSPDAWAKLALASAQWEAKQPSAFEQLLKLGLPVVGGLMSYNDAKSRNKAAEAYTDQLKQRDVNYAALAKKTSLPPGGYAALKVINPVSLAPKLV